MFAATLDRLASGAAAGVLRSAVGWEAVHPAKKSVLPSLLRWRSEMHQRQQQRAAHAAASLQGAQAHVMSPEEYARRHVDWMHPALRAVLVDVAGTLLIPSEPAAEVYLRYGHKYGVALSEPEVLERFRRAYNTPWGQSSLRYEGDGRPFWRRIVAASTGCDDAGLFEEVYGYYARPQAWAVLPGAVDALRRLRAAGLKTAVVSNFDTRLRPILRGLALEPLFDAFAISAEVGVEKPNPIIFEAACAALGVQPHEAMHVGDDRRNDVAGARDAGCYTLLWGTDVHSWGQLADLLLLGKDPDDDEGDEGGGDGQHPR